MNESAEKEKELLPRILDIFLRCGIRSLTMDDIAAELKISKKTLYTFVKDKKDLVNKVMALNCAEDKSCCEVMTKESENAIDEILRISKHVGGKLQAVHPSVHYDLRKYYPAAWETMQQYHHNFVLTCIQENIERGIKEGFYRENINAEIISRIYISKIDIVFNADVFPPTQYNFLDVYAEMLVYHMHGIASPKGLKYFTKR